jgi:hypothetical protein
MWASASASHECDASSIGFISRAESCELLESGRCLDRRIRRCSSSQAVIPPPCISAAPMQKPPPFGRGFLA